LLTYTAPSALGPGLIYDGLATAIAAFSDYGGVGGDADLSGSGDVALFAKGGSGTGGSVGGSGGTAPKQYVKSNAAGMTFVVNWDSSVAKAPSGFVTGFESAVQYFLNTLATPITITLDVGYGEVLGQGLPFGVLGESEFGVSSYLYSAVYGAMQSKATGHAGTPEAQGFATLPDPSANPNPLGATNYLITTADQKALGLAANDGSLDGAVGFAKNSFLVPWNYNSTTTSRQYDFVSVAKHEISEVMGRVAWVGESVGDGSVTYANSYSNLDLFRYSAPGTRATTTGGAAYFSYDGGTTNQSSFNTNPSAGDLGDWSGATKSNDAFNYASGLGPAAITTADTNELNVLGYQLA
jgi:hypothetical protein